MSQEPDNYRHKWFVMAAVALSIFMVAVDATIVNVTQPTLVEVFQTQFAVVQWVALAYLLVVATLLLSVGRLADIQGKKLLFVAGLALFTTGSALCALAPDIWWLIGLRVVQAVGGAMHGALGLAILTEAVPPRERGKALGLIGAFVAAGAVAAPIIGGALIQLFSWRAIFLVNLPVGILGIILALRYVPASRPSGKQRFDYLGAATLGVGLLALLLALTTGQQLGFTAPAILLLFALALISLCAFVAIEWRSAQPMIDLRLFRDPLIGASVFNGFILFAAVSGAMQLVPFYLQNVLHFPASQLGLLMAVGPLAIGMIAPFAGTLSDRFGPRRIAGLGLVASLAGYIAASTLDQGTTVAGYLLRILPIGIGFGLFDAPNSNAMMGAAPREQLGVVSGLLAISRGLGQAVGVAVFGAVWAGRVYGYAGDPRPATPTSAPVAAQVAGLTDTMLVVGALVALAVAVAALGIVRDTAKNAVSIQDETGRST